LPGKINTEWNYSIWNDIESSARANGAATGRNTAAGQGTGRETMIVEIRTYVFKCGSVPAFLSTYETNGLEIQKRILGNLLGYFTTESGPLNQVVHLWGYASPDDRMARRAALVADPGWKKFLAEILPMLVSQESQILLPTAFSPIR
jgi:hypothetical protein